MMTVDATLQLARSANGYLVRIAGRGTLQESLAFQQLVDQCLQGGEAAVVVDLSRCVHLDSTFLGCLIELQRTYGDGDSTRFQVHADQATRLKLFSTNLLDRLLHFTEAAVEPVSGYVAIEPNHSDLRELGRHILQCHQQLASLGGESAVEFGPIADRLAEELEDET